MGGQSATIADGGKILALLGPTNTGKTHRAIERMLELPSGMIGLPLRLLAREIYDKISARIGERSVALVTGEEKRIGDKPRYWVCTVESMPVDRTVDFVAVDEVQLAAHPQRGHVFTDRLLHARGRHETWFLGADTMRPLMAELVPTAEIQRNPRMSKLSAAGSTSIGTLPPRSAVIAFSAAEVYALAERLRRRRGGAAVVLGALSPRTRNAQVAMYQAGEVDFLVATDAIGMGLNMDVDHVAFAALRKFDGEGVRALSPAELAQIAGRAGRHTRDGTFGALAPLELGDELSFAIETHRFAPVRRVMWRNSDLDTSSIHALMASLAQRPKQRSLELADDADDEKALKLLAARDDVRARAARPETVRLLWDVCKIPDFRKLLTEHHAALLAELFLQLSGPEERIDVDFMHQRISRLENDEGDIDTLLMRMEFMRTWNYIAHHSAWVDDAPSWQARTQRAEDMLSQALHQALIERFVASRRRQRPARSRPRLPSRPQAADPPPAHGPFAELWAMRDKLRDAEAAPIASDAFVEDLIAAGHADFRIAGSDILFQDEVVASFARGKDLLHPEVKLVATDLGPGGSQRALRRIRAFARDFVDETLGPLRDERLAELSPAGRGLLYQLEQQLGSVPVRSAASQLRSLSDADRALLSRASIHRGRRFVYVERLLAPDAIERRAALCRAHADVRWSPDGESASLPLNRMSRDLLIASGFEPLGARAVRIDVAEQVAGILDGERPPFALPPSLPALLACSADEAERIVTAMGYPRTAEGFVRPRRRT